MVSSMMMLSCVAFLSNISCVMSFGGINTKLRIWEMNILGLSPQSYVYGRHLRNRGILVFDEVP
jgi:hypothetical protein